MNFVVYVLHKPEFPLTTCICNCLLLTVATSFLKNSLISYTLSQSVTARHTKQLSHPTYPIYLSLSLHVSIVFSCKNSTCHIYLVLYVSLAYAELHLRYSHFVRCLRECCRQSAFSPGWIRVPSSQLCSECGRYIADTKSNMKKKRKTNQPLLGSKKPQNWKLLVE